MAEYSNIASGGGTSYLTADMLGSTRAITDPAERVRARHDYLPFGEEIGAGVAGRTTGQGYVRIADGNRKRWAQLERDDETGLDYANARYYSNLHGRFTSPDPILSSGRIEAPQTWNKYHYALGNPLKYSDPLGLYEYLAGTTDEDKKRINKAYESLLAARDKYKADSKEYQAIDRSLKALGAPGEKNGVTVYVDNGLKNPGSTMGAPQYDENGFATGKAEAAVGLNLSKFEKGDVAGLAGVLGHEGSHVADHQSEIQTLAGLGMGEVNRLSQEGRIMSKAITEVNAYRVSSYIAAAISSNPLSFNGYQIWNRSWSAAEANQMRDAGIRGVLESPKGSYNYRFVPPSIPLPVPILNNALDNPRLWVVNGGTLF